VSNQRLAIAFATALAAALVSRPVVLPALRRFLRPDLPSERSSHEVPTPRGGGLIVAIGLLVGWAAELPATRIAVGFCASAALYGMIGFVDDVRPLGARFRLGAQLVAGATALVWLTEIAPTGIVGVGFCLGSIFVLVGFVNAFNFMDGINGISAVHGAVGGVAFVAAAAKLDAVVPGVIGAALTGASLGFLPVNLRRQALTFLGDVGSYLLGAVLAGGALLLWRAGATVEAAAAPLSLYLADTSTTLLKRWRRGEDVLAAHREHAYQQLTPPGASHARTALATGALTSFASLLGYLSIGASTGARVGLGTLTVALLAAYVTLPTSDRLRRFLPTFEHSVRDDHV
jgi:UDP-GlcNAc:undecaprenyl-phosphate/decaprenyl-phosphate GlcNAc-1-phosphate transferase